MSWCNATEEEMSWPNAAEEGMAWFAGYDCGLKVSSAKFVKTGLSGWRYHLGYWLSVLS